MASCSTCLDLQIPIQPNGITEPHWITPEALCDTANAGCLACIMIHNAIEGWAQANDRSLLNSDEIFFHPKPINDPLQIHVSNMGEERTTRHLELYPHEDSPTLWPIIGAGRNISRDSSSGTCIELARSWITECSNNHQMCPKPTTTILPTRVLEIGPENSQLHLTLSKGEKGSYVALSHCWGGRGAITTTTRDLISRLVNIPFERLPKTFQDAVVITRRLGMSYLWIDSLCIIQDSAEDWAIEASKMAAIYRNAAVTIAADGAEDSSQGCFIAGTKRINAICTESPDKNGGKLKVWVRLNGTRSTANDIAHGEEFSYKRSKLSTRAWVFQERLLSPRTLHFTALEMSWECASQVACECRLEPEQTNRFHFKPRYTTGSADSEDERPVRFRWHAIVEEFTLRDLTYSSDRLPALSGIAGVMAQTQSQDYLAGLWRSNFIAGLLWKTNYFNYVKTACVNKRHTKYYAPTWSWASVTGPVEYRCEGNVYEEDTGPEEDLYPDVRILDVRCIPASANKFGTVESGYVDLVGYVVSVQLKSNERDDPQQSGHNRHWTASSVQRLDVHARNFALSTLIEPDVKGAGYEIDEGEPHFLLLLERERGSTKAFGIVLRASRVDGGSFERVGFLEDKRWSLSQWRILAERKQLRIL